MTRKLLEKFVKQYGNGWYIPKELQEKTEIFNIISRNAELWIQSFPNIIPTGVEWESCSLHVKEKYDNLISRKMVTIVKKFEDGYIIYCFKYSNAINIYRLVSHAMSPNIFTKLLNNSAYIDNLTMKLYKDIIEYTGKNIYLFWDMYSDEELIERGKKYGIIGYRDEKLGWVWRLDGDSVS